MVQCMGAVRWKLQAVHTPRRPPDAAHSAPTPLSYAMFPRRGCCAAMVCELQVRWQMRDVQSSRHCSVPNRAGPGHVRSCAVEELPACCFLGRNSASGIRKERSPARQTLLPNKARRPLERA